MKDAEPRDIERLHAENLREAEELAKRDIERHKNDPIAPHVAPHTEQEVEAIIQRTHNAPKGGPHFDPYNGWSLPEDHHESDTYRSLKEVIAALKKNPTDAIFDAVERLLYNYQIFVRQGHGRFGKLHADVSWYLTDKDPGKSCISYQDGKQADWVNDAWADEAPLWLLIGLLRKIKAQKPLGDQKADETIENVNDLDARYVQRPRDDYAQHLGMEDDDGV